MLEVTFLPFKTVFSSACIWHQQIPVDMSFNLLIVSTDRNPTLELIDETATILVVLILMFGVISFLRSSTSFPLLLASRILNHCTLSNG